MTRVAILMCFCVYNQTLTGVSETQGPETQIGGRVGNAAQAVLYGVNCLMQEDVSEMKLPMNKHAVRTIYTRQVL